LKNRNILRPAPADWNLFCPGYNEINTTGGIKVYSIDSGDHEICYAELVFENGRLGEEVRLSSRLCANQLLEGSQHKNQREIAEFFDYYGCTYQVHADLDFTVISINTLYKYFDIVFTFLIEQITTPVFAEENLLKEKISLRSQLSHQLSEPDFVSYRELSAQVFGEDNVYGYNTSEQLIDKVTSADIEDYFRNNYTADKLKVFYCGPKLPELFWHQRLSDIPASGKKLHCYERTEYTMARKHFPIARCAQTSLKMGLPIFNKTAEDYFPMYVINTILGDYFGSRLMSQVREKHGLCYDIGSTLDAQLYDGVFYISAELNESQTNKAIQIIQEETRKLQEKGTYPGELQMVKNYLNGHLLRMIDGPYQSILLIKILTTEFKDVNAFGKLIDTIRNISDDTIKKVSTTYLDCDKMSIITAGAG